MHASKRVSALVCAVAFLAGCKSDGTSTESNVTLSPSVGTDVLSSYFVKSFDAFEDAAQRLRTYASRYTVQRHSWTLGESKVYDSYPLAASRVEYAHAAGLTGKRQTVSVVDSGFLLGHETLAGKVLDLPDNGLAVDSHGTGVASVLAGDSDDMVGIAPGAALSLGEFGTMQSRTEATRRATRIGAVAQNNSWGFPTLSATPDGFQSLLSGGGRDYLSALETYAAQGVVVFAVDNDETRTTSSIMEALPKFRPGLEDGWLAVVNAVPEFNSERILSADRISSACLDAARWCLTADGGWVAASDASATSYKLVTGSSFAAPQVAGALALLAEAFPALSSHDLRIRLLASADNGFFAHEGQQELAPGFFHGYGEEFGHGFLDIRAALLPIGAPTLQMENGDVITSNEPVMVSGVAIGDAVATALAGQSVLVTDALAGDFNVSAAALTGAVSPLPMMTDRLDDLGAERLAAMRNDRPGLGTDLFDRFPASVMSLGTPTGTEVALMLPPWGGADANIGIALEQTVSAAWGDMHVGVGVLRDGTGVLGALPAREESRPLAGNLTLGATANLIGDGFLAIEASFGVAGGSGAMSSTTFDSYAIAMGTRNAFIGGDRLTLGVELPHAVRSGETSIALPVARDAAGALSYRDMRIGLAPEQREVDFTIRYEAPMAGSWNVMAEAAYAVNRGNVGDISDAGLMVGFSRQF